MFGFKKKKNKDQIKDSSEKIILTQEREKELLNEINIKKNKLEEADTNERAKIYEEIGMDFYELQQEENAIQALEESLEIKKSIGNGYKTLLKLYNKKRAEAANANDDDVLQIYLKKMDKMMQISKDVTRGL